MAGRKMAEKGGVSQLGTVMSLAAIAASAVVVGGLKIKF